MNTIQLLLLALAALAANLPFMTNRRLFVLPAIEGRSKHFLWQLFELVLIYLIFGLCARFIEARVSPIHQQEWPFYATTFALFVVAAYPGFVIRYFWRKPGV